jgi:TolB protein
MRLPIYLIVLALGLAACSAETTDSPSLVVLDGGNVVIMDPDGSNPLPLTEGTENVYFQPVWSPDGGMVAFSQVAGEPELHVALSDGTSDMATETGTVPFYFSWSADNEVALLRTGDSGFRLERVAVSDDSLSEPTLVDSGQPLYYSWSPDGLAVATHIGTERLETVDSDGAAESLGVEPGLFQAPRWTDRGVIAVEQGLRDQRLVVIAPDGTSTPMATLPGPATFVATDAGDKVALQSVIAGVNGLNAALQALPNVPANRLVLGDLDEQVFTPVTSDPVLAYFWAPSADRLLILDVVEGPQTRWSIWSDDGLEEIVRFDPEPSFMAEMVPFFDQYAQSVSLWAPDGSAFAFPGNVDDEPGIWVYTLDGGLDRISSGTWVSWSP